MDDVTDEDQQPEHLSFETEEEASSTDATDESDESWRQEPTEDTTSVASVRSKNNKRTRRSNLNIRRISATEIAPKKRLPIHSKHGKHSGPKSSFMASLNVSTNLVYRAR